MRDPQDTKYVWDEENFKIIQNSISAASESELVDTRKFLRQTQELCNEYLDAKITAESERDEANHELNKKYIEYDKLFDVAELIKTERDQILDALMKIEEIFIDGADTYNDWLAMGSIARAALEKLNK
jgi:hypothetical protein